MTPRLPKLHAVTDDRVVELHDFTTRAAAIAQSGSVALHARAPGREGRELLEIAQSIGAAVAHSGSTLFVNDRVDVARAASAAGVHLPAGGLPVAEVRGLVGLGVSLGRSTHDPDRAREALAAGADYVFLGPIWPTASHPGARTLGPDAIAAVGAGPVIVIGGVTAERAHTCLAAGAYGVAVVSALWQASDPGRAAEDILLLLE